MIDLQDAFDVYQKALSVREERIDLISSNINNQDTPGFKARDIDFKSVMSQVAPEQNHLPLVLPESGGIQSSDADNTENYRVKYRIPTSPSVDGNTVSQNYEKVAFMNNAVRYDSTLAFIQAKKAALMEVIKGDQ